MVLGSAASFGPLPVLVKFAYATGLTPLQTLSYRFLRGASALTASALVHTGAGVSLFAVLLLSGEPVIPRNAASWPFLVLLAVVPSMIAISLLLAGLPRIGAPHAALLSTIEPVVTLAL